VTRRQTSASLRPTLQLPGALHVNSAQTYKAAALTGLGLIQAPLLGIGRYLESRALVEIMPDFRRRSLAVSLVVAHRSNLSRRVRAFMKADDHFRRSSYSYPK
jgi:DNA-binding transcriptional LysR family regulator